MLKIFIVLVLSMNLSFAEQLSGNFILKESKINYLVKYLIKKADGSSIGAKGKGECKDSCQFLVAAPIKSFESKDANRDLNMLSTVKADKYPLVSAMIKTSKEIADGKMLADLDIDFVGIKKSYSKIPFKFQKTETGFKVEGSFDLLLDQHQVVKPSLLGVDIENAVPIEISANFEAVK